MNGGYGHGSLSSSGGKTSIFTGERNSPTVLFTCDLTKFATSCVKGVFEARRASTSMNEIDCVPRLMLQSKTSSNVPFSAMVVSTASIYE